ncbi:sel1 repeat family protein [Rhizobium sp. 3T7]|uniref:tetratricopeptide repeat protein n=1 Tax=Rhizobium sp. 3T7 TaxID=2874922 RepID=UPI001CCFA098|nr:sel1 repeat family protein [Rhizobium sp. 3T7]MBZ9793057.1 sel1 repeat family protein [Rhizobium sp. 3T7]
MSNGNEIGSAAVGRRLGSFRRTALAATLAFCTPVLATNAIAATETLIPLSPDFDYAQMCVTPPAVPAPRNWNRWDGKSTGTLSPDDMLQDAQTLFSPYSLYQRSPATAERIALYLSQVPFAGAGRALHLYGRILADDDNASLRVDEIIRVETEAIKRGTIEAGTFLGRLYREGELLPVDLKKSQGYLTAAANAGDPAAELELARLYYRNPQLAETADANRLYLNRAISKMSDRLGAGDCSVLTGFADILIDPDLGLDDQQTSAQWLQAAVKLGDVRAMSTLARRYLQDSSVAANQQKAVGLLRQASALGHSASRLTLADLLLSTPPDGSGKNEAFKLLAQEAERGNPRAYEMKAAYYRGAYGAGADPGLELQSLQKAAVLPDVSLRTMEQLGIIYARGSAGAPNFELAKQTLVKAADLGSSRSAFELYKLASGEKPAIKLDKDPLTYLSAAADHGLGVAMSELSSLYFCGAGVEKDRAKARVWLEKAAAAGNAASLLTLADEASAKRTSDGNAAAAKFLTQAAEQGDVEAMMRVSLSYRDGQGTEKDAAAAKTWRQRAMTADPGVATLTEARAALSPDAPEKRDAIKARAMLEASAPTGNPDLLFELARLYIDPDPTLEPDPTKATALFVEAASKGSISAMLRLVDMKVAATDGGGADWRRWLARANATGDLRALLKQAEIESDAEQQATILKAALSRPLCLDKEKIQVALAIRTVPQFKQDYLGLFDQVIAEPTKDPSTEYQIARFLLNERPAEKAKAIELMKDAAEGGKREAMREIGRMYSTGEGLPVDQKNSYMWLLRSARLGDEGALESLVTEILSQQATLNDPSSGDEKVETLLRDLAAQNSPQVATLLSRLYLRLSEGSPAFTQAAKSWTLKAATLGNGAAMLNVSDFYAAGTHGFEHSDTKSTEWLSKAAHAGYRGAFEKYAIALQIGFGTKADTEEAQRWLTKSTDLAN